MHLADLGSGMRRRSLLALSGTALTTALAGCSAAGSDGATPTDTETPGDTTTPADGPDPTTGTTEPALSTTLRNGSFEDDWAAWEVGRDVPTDPNRPGDRPVGTGVGVTTRGASDGGTSLQLFIDGSQDDGTVWVQQPVDLSGAASLAVDYRVSTSFNEIMQAAVYAGPDVEGGLAETDFDRSNSLAGHDAGGWKTFVYEVTHDGPGVVAVGANIVWETGARAALDNVRLTESEPDRVTPTPSETTDGGGIEDESTASRTASATTTE